MTFDGAGGSQDLTPYVEAEGALLFDVTVHKAPAGAVTVEVHCEWPCVSSVPAKSLFERATLGRKTMVKIPLTCFTARKLDPKKVNTPFLVNTNNAFSATFSNVRWEAGAATGSDATPCDRLQ